MGERIRGSAGQKARKRRLARTHGLCERCSDRGIVRLATAVDHEKPLALGGEDIDSNTRNLCATCHGEVTADQFSFRKRVAVDVEGWPIVAQTRGEGQNSAD